MKNLATNLRPLASRLALGGALLGLAACASTSANAPRDEAAFATTRTTSAAAGGESVGSPHAEISVAVRAKDDGAGDDPRGVLVVREDVLAQCPRLGAGPTAGKMAWLEVMRGVAGCMKDGELKDRSLVLRGPSRPQVVVKYLFAKLGVPEARVQMSAPDGTACASDADCTAEERRVEVGLAGAAPVRVGAL